MTTAAPDPKPPYKALKPGEIRTDLIPSEWALTPLNGKRAYVPGWTNSPFTLNQIEEELKSGKASGIGLLTGQHCNEYGLIWVDLDGPEATPFLEDLAGGPLETIFPPTLTITSGKPGRMRLLYKISNENINRIPDKATLKIGNAPLELLWRSRQGAIMGTHPETEGYSTTQFGGFEYAKNLPELPDWLYDAIARSYPSNKYRKRNTASAGVLVAQNINLGYEEGSLFQKEALEEEIRDYLKDIKPERADDYEEWVAIGMALHQCGDEFLEVWIEWSAQSDHFEDGCCEAKWASFERLPGGPAPEGARGLPTLRAKAKEDGYVDFGGFEVPSVENTMRRLEKEHGPNVAKLLVAGIGANSQAIDDEDLEEFEEFAEQFEQDDESNDVGEGEYFGGKKKGTRNPPASEIADHIFGYVVKMGWKYDPKYDRYLKYNKENGIWEREKHKKAFQHDIQMLLGGINLSNGYSTNLVNDVCNLVESNLVNASWDDDSALLAFKNGVLNITNGDFLNHDPENYITWGLDFEYAPDIDPGPIVEWLTRSQYGDQGRLQVLRAWLRACLVGKGNELQRFLEIIGPGGRGKSTYANLCCALVGLGNYASTNLNQLEQSRFELASIKDKRLTLINDSERYGGSAQTFKALTGGDSLRYEEKLKAIGEPFVYTGMVMVVANEPIQTTDNTSGLARRRLTIEFNRKLYDKNSEARDMIKINQGHVSGYWKDYLPGLVNWVLAMSDQEMRQYLLDTNEMVPSLKKVRNNILLNSNNLIEFLQSECVAAENQVSCIGKKIPNTDKEKPERYYNSTSHLYPAYCEYCESTGSKAVGQKRFVNLLLDVCKNQLDMDKVSTFSKGGRIFFKGLAVRASDQKFKDYPTILTEGKEAE